MNVTNSDIIIPVQFQLERNGRKNISTEEYIQLLTHSKSYTICKGKTVFNFSIVHTSAGYVDIYTSKSGAIADWMADNFEIKAVVADEKNDHYAIIETEAKTVRMPFEAFLANKIDTAFFNKGIAISKVAFAHEALSLHLQWMLGNFEVKDAAVTLGWTYNNNKELTWCGTNKEPPLLKYNLSLPSETEYIEKLSLLMRDSIYLQFVVCTAAASVLLAYLKMTAKMPLMSFGLSLVGTSSTGKTTALQLAASMFSSPDDEAVFTGFYGTNNALVHMLGMHHGVPLCYDETTIDNNLNKSNFIYTFSEGKSKLRLDQQSQLKERYTWECTSLFCSETYLVDISNNDNLGLGVRILNLENCSFTKNAQHADEIKVFSRQNYGIIGNKISDYLLNENSESVTQDYNEIKETLTSLTFLKKSQLTDRLILNFALILHTAGILVELGIDIDIKVMRNICVDINNKIAESAQPGKNLICKIFNLISSRYKNLQGIKWTCEKDGKPVKVAIVETTFAEMLKELNIADVKSSVNALDKEGFLIRQSAKRLKSKLNIDGVPCYAYQFDITKVNQAFGAINEEVFSNVQKHKSFDSLVNEKFDILNDKEAIIHEGNYKVRRNKNAVSGTAFLL